MAKLDAGLRYLISSSGDDLAELAADSAFGVRAIGNQPATAGLLVEFTGNREALEAAGLRVRTQAGAVFTGDIPVDRIDALEGLDGLVRAEVARVLSAELDQALPAANVAPVHAGGNTGKGVIVGIIDSGIDYQHPSFRQSNGKTRILAIWDQRLQPLATEHSPAPFNFGVEYKAADIDTALASSTPFTVVRHRDSQIPLDGFHGTHVAGIAAGNGRPSTPGAPAFVGVAPEADLIVVANTRGRAQNERGLGDSADTLDAVRYILTLAGDRPVVINQSQGDNVGPHDGTSLLEVGMANLLGGAGKVIVKSAGNEGERNRHARGVLTAAAPQNVTLSVPNTAVAQVVVDLWYPDADRFGVSIVPPSGVATAVVAPPQTVTLTLSNGNTAFVDSDLNVPGNGDNRIFVVLQGGVGVQAGVWTLRITPIGIVSGEWHAWIQRNSASQFQPPFVDRSATISIPGTSPAVITAGSFVSNGSATGSVNGTLSTFSSRGPTRDGRRAPTLAAPGEELTAPQPLSPPGSFGPMSGTSMAAPMVTGAVALMLKKRKTATAAQVRQCLEQSATLDGDTGAAPSNDWGAGKLNVDAAVQCI
jgi:subtilisin family serine protease